MAKTVKTQVFKASLDIGSGTLSDFVSELTNAATDLYPNALWSWIEEVRPGSLVIYVEETDSTEYYRVEYKRNLDGTFEFGTPELVIRVSSFVSAPKE